MGYGHPCVTPPPIGYVPPENRVCENCSFTHVDNWGGGGGAGVNHVKRDWPEIFNVNCDLYI